ncbi:MAG: hypothetical protein HY392_05390 [Candidatus Diapherotrites archaeon]|nr:hypothetical protein [Candidatus Diapherotrites archaeon]
MTTRKYFSLLAAFLFLLVIITLAQGKATTIPPCTPLPPNTISWWPGDGNANDVVGDNNGTLENGAGFGTGKVNQAFRLDGRNDYVNVPDSPSLDINGPITIEAWVYPLSYPHYAGIVSKNSYSNRTYKFVINSDLDGLYFELKGVGGYVSVITNYKTHPLASIIPLDRWSHVAAVYDGSDLIIYSNGSEVARKTVGTITILTNAKSLKIGSDEGERVFHGGIDEVGIYNRGLSQAEILEIVNAGRTGKCRSEQIIIKNATLPSATTAVGCAENSLTNKIYCFGGRRDPLGQIVEYTPFTDILTVKNAVLPGPTADTSCAENSTTHKIYCFGGVEHDEAIDRIVEYDTDLDRIVVKNATLPTPRGNAACVENKLTHKIYCFGGLPHMNQIVEYDPETDTIAIKNATLPSPTASPSCAENSATHKIYCFGGSDTYRVLDTIVEYTPSEDLLVVKSAVLPTPRSSLSCGENSQTHKIYCLGGAYRATLTTQIVGYDTNVDSIRIQNSTLPTARTTECSENSATHKIYCFGGQEQDRGYLDQILEYTPP